MNFNGTEYYYLKNAQGDIIGLTDNTGTQVVSYTYDSWGKLISIDGTLKDTVGVKNPYRYRSYRYDTETGLYYLQSRYYKPEWGRLLNADDPTILQAAQGQLLNTNLFSYCNNSPVMNSDPTGHWVISLLGLQTNWGGIHGFMLAVCLVFDGHGNVGLLFTVGIGLSTPSLGISRTLIGFYWVNSIFNLRGISYVSGGSVPVYGPVSVGADLTLGKNGRPIGFSIGIGAGISETFIEGHALGTVSVYLVKLNTRKWASNLYALLHRIHVKISV